MNNQQNIAELNRILQSATATDSDRAWAIYRYMSANVGGELSSDEARQLMLTYLQLPLPRPSLVHSLMLGIALKMTEKYADFRLPGFLQMWDVANLRREDHEPSRSKDGRTFRPLVQKMAMAIIRYSVKHPDDAFAPMFVERSAEIASEAGFLPVKDMVAVKVFEAMHERRKVRMVKLVAADGTELAADWHIFGCKPWEIAGKMYRVLPRRSEQSANVRVDTVAISPADISTEFGRFIGFVDRYDPTHRHYHIFDNLSRHFVAETPGVRITEGQFVWFAPVVPSEDKFKTAIVIDTESRDAGVKAFGTTEGTVTFVDAAKGFFGFVTADGSRGSGQLSIVGRQLTIGDKLQLIAYLRRGKDGEKRLRAVISI